MGSDLIPQEAIQNKILFIREKRVMLDRDLAILYEVETKQLKRAVKRITLYNATRHSFGSQRINAGFNRDEIGAVMGHKKSETTKKYTRILTENLKTVMEGTKVVKLTAVTKSSPRGISGQ